MALGGDDRAGRVASARSPRPSRGPRTTRRIEEAAPRQGCSGSSSGRGCSPAQRVPDSLDGLVVQRRDPDVYLWEKIRPLDPLPRRTADATPTCRPRSDWPASNTTSPRGRRTAAAHARVLDAGLGRFPGSASPHVRSTVSTSTTSTASTRPIATSSCASASAAAWTSRRCTWMSARDLELFGAPGRAPGATRAAEAFQLPVYSSLDEDEVRAVTARIRRVVTSGTHHTRASTAATGL